MNTDTPSANAQQNLSMRNEIDRIIIPLIAGRAEHICLIDLPNYANVGDHAILLGELQFLERCFPESILSYFDINSYSEACDPLIERASVILINGGGNFGDIWPHHQKFRLHILGRFSDKRVIQMPQSISFASQEAISLTARAIEAHGDFHLVVRDKASKAFADAQFGCNVLLSPDMAFYLTRLDRLPATINYYCLLRTDKERVANHRAIVDALSSTNESFAVGDWINEVYSMNYQIDRTFVRLTSKWPRVTWPLMPTMLSARRRYARERVAVGIELLSQGRIVITDRLHAHIMSCLMGIPNVFFDTLDGKVSACHSTWTRTFVGSQLVSVAGDLRAALRAVSEHQEMVS